MNWLPRPIRDGITDFLEFAVVKSRLYAGVAPRLMRAISQSGETDIVDLCSGGGGAWLDLVDQLPSHANRVLLTDLYPNIEAFSKIRNATNGRIQFSDTSVDATEVRDDLNGFRTLFSSFHHLRPELAREVLADAVENNAPIAVLESTQRHILLILYMLVTPILVLLATPFMTPFRWSRLFFTYIIPAIPLIVAFDGVVSCLRTYTVEELEALVATLPANDFDWSIGVHRLRGLPVGVTYLIGLPASSGDQ